MVSDFSDDEWHEWGTVKLAIQAASRALLNAKTAVDRPDSQAPPSSVELAWATITEFIFWIGSITDELRKNEFSKDMSLTGRDEDRDQTPSGDPLLGAFWYLRNKQAHRFLWSLTAFRVRNRDRNFSDMIWPRLEDLNIIDEPKGQEVFRQSYLDMLAGRSISTTGSEVLLRLAFYVELLAEFEEEENRDAELQLVYDTFMSPEDKIAFDEGTFDDWGKSLPDQPD